MGVINHIQASKESDKIRGEVESAPLKWSAESTEKKFAGMPLHYRLKSERKKDGVKMVSTGAYLRKWAMKIGNKPKTLFSNDFDEIFVSKAFTDSFTPDYVFKLGNVKVGGP